MKRGRDLLSGVAFSAEFKRWFYAEGPVSALPTYNLFSIYLNQLMFLAGFG